jgi:hypothetical protein
MATAGYSKRTLVEKLGIKSRLPASATFIHQFVRRRKDLTADFPSLARALTDQGTLWISWPKQTSGADTDLNENVVREIGLRHGLVDVKVATVDEVWSGLKFVRRVGNRAGKVD